MANHGYASNQRDDQFSHGPFSKVNKIKRPGFAWLDFMGGLRFLGKSVNYRSHILHADTAYNH